MTRLPGTMRAPEKLRDKLVRLEFLVVTDSRFERQLLQDMLKTFGALRVYACSTPEEACHQLLTPDIIFLDWVGANIHGVRQFSQPFWRRREKPTVIALMSSPSPEQVAAAVQGGASGVVAKPYSMNSLMSQAARAFSQRSQEFAVD